MAVSDSHRLGQLIGVMLEKAIQPKLREILPDNSFYLDTVNTDRNVRGKKRKVSWVDYQGNKHDLDFVIEKNGTLENYGTPKAFIECAWRRYTKHSKNKVQEIQGAILPLAKTYHNENPFLGAILAGDFTEPSLKQLTSSGFKVLYISYNEIVDAYLSIGLDISFDENTNLEDLKIKADNLSNLNGNQLNLVIGKLYSLIEAKLATFLNNLKISLNRFLKRILIQPTYASIIDFTSIEEAKNYLVKYKYDVAPNNLTFEGLFMYIEYSNGDNLKAEFREPTDALNFLENI
ncbi:MULTISPECIES: hypothetical protein [unclassified Moraxella]|uniref:hypothetical protein n=1 Tax=unclassified Moraxella TaxID=2685852 RepID=UPI003AF7C04F